MAFNRKNKTITTSGGQEVSSDLFETNKLKKYDDEEWVSGEITPEAAEPIAVSTPQQEIEDNYSNDVPAEPIITPKPFVKKAPVINNEQTKEQLLKLQKKLVFNAATNNSFFTEISDSSNNLMDVSRLLRAFPENGLKDLFEKDNVTFPFSKMKALDKTENSKTKSKESKQKSLRTHLTPKEIDRCKMQWARVQEYNNSVSKDSGHDCLFLGYPFIQGQLASTSDNKFSKLHNVFYAPLLFWKVRIGFNEENNPFIILTKKNNKPVVQINTEILAHAHLNNDINEQLFESNPDIEFNYNANSFAQSIVEKFNSNNIQLTPEIKSAIEESLTSYPHSPFVNLDKYNSIDDSKDLPLNIIGSVVIGSFTPSESGLFQEYSKLMNNGGIDYLNKLKFRTYDAIKLAEEAGIPFKEAHLKEIVQLDFAQKKATKIALEDSLVIIGPPGTGKSQTISNIIANLISQSKSVLFTTALVGAADVVFNRLKRLRLYCLKLFETDNLRKEFTKQIRNNVNRITKLIEIRNQLDLASATNNAEDLDEIFKRVCEFKSLMYHADGHKYPKFVVDFNKEKDNLNKALALVSAQVKKAENSRVFWTQIRTVKDTDDEFSALIGFTTSINMKNEEVAAVFPLMKTFDNSADFYDLVLTEFVSTYLSTLKQADGTIAKLPEKIQDHPKYLEFKSFFQKIDDANMETMRIHDKLWFEKLLAQSQTTNYKNIVEFAKTYSNDNFDFDLAKSVKPMMEFANINSNTLKVDEEDYHTNINEILKGKLQEDINECEKNFAETIFSIIYSDKSYYTEFNELYSYINGIEMVQDVQEVLRKYARILTVLFPVIICSPTLVPNIVRCEKGIFDQIIFDESSQITLEKALPILYRGQQFCCVGDLKQLPPPSYFSNIEKQKELAKSMASLEVSDDFENNLIDGCTSLLDYLQKKSRVTMLNYHYRCKTKDLIQFSNVAFYNNSINVADSPTPTSTGLKCVNVNGEYKDGINVQEAAEVIKIIEKIVNDPRHNTPNYNDSIGVITFSMEQKNYIESLIKDHPSKLISNELGRVTDDGEDISLFVRTVADVQGAERNNIIISMGFSERKSDKTFHKSITILNSEIGKNYINVMFSRAIDNMYVVKSFNSDYIYGNNLSDSVKALKNFIHYVELFDKFHSINNPNIEAIFLPYKKESAEFDFTIDTTNKGSEWLQESLAEEIRKIIDINRFDIEFNHFEGKTNINIVLKDKKTGAFPLGVICDNFIFDFSVSQKERDYYSQAYLEVRGWNLFRVSSLQWCKSWKRQSLLDRFKKQYDKMVTKLDEPAVKTIRKPRKQSNVKHLKAKKVMSKRTGKAKPKKHKR